MADAYTTGGNMGDFYKQVFGVADSPLPFASDNNSGISAQAWQNYNSPDVMRVTPEGLNVRGVQSVQINPDGTPVRSGGGLSAITPWAPSGAMQFPSGSGAAPFAGKSSSGTIDAANPLNIDRLGLTSDPFRKETSATQAIGDALIGGGSSGSMWGPSWDIGINPDLQWQAAGSSPAPRGDTWSGLRSPEENINGVAPRTGMITGARPAAMPMRGLAAIQAPQQQAAPRPITYSAVPVAAGNFAAGSPNASFEKQNGMGSVSNQQASSSRWNTGY